MRQRHADMAGCKQGRAGVGPVVLTGQLPAAAGDDAFGAVQYQVAAGIVAADPITGGVVEALDRGSAAALQNALEAGFGSIRDDQPGLWQGAHQVVKLCLDRCKIVENIGMIEFQVI